MRNQFEMDERAPLKRMLCLVRPFRLRSIAGACGCTFPPYKAALILRTISRFLRTDSHGSLTWRNAASAEAFALSEESLYNKALEMTHAW
ncbi:unnamed protein product [Cylicocyclus nassatus]|uniref:Uncharacterized protein n=1 Tax=Cylicocyclus nassatus TaxID=53992 RepID=A0AA36GXS8_CYLNA|nr:unnamed protein product [Cylicocyclus nassatus]